MEDTACQSPTYRRFPGKYIVIGMALFMALLLGGSLILSIGLTPAAERFHNPTLPTQK